MEKYIRKFDNYTNANEDNSMSLPFVKAIDGISDHALYGEPLNVQEDRYFNQYLTINIGQVTPSEQSLTYTKDNTITGDLYYSYDKTTWTKYTSTITFSSNTIFLKGNLSPSLSGSGIGNIKCSGSFNGSIYGNIMSLCYGDNFKMHEGCNEPYYFKELFAHWDASLISGPQVNLQNLCLPLTLSKYCFYKMFYNTSISALPLLNAVHLEEGCYMDMFKYDNINKNVSATLISNNNNYILPAKYVPKNAYTGMFDNTKRYYGTSNNKTYTLHLNFLDYENEDAIRLFGLIPTRATHQNSEIVNYSYTINTNSLHNIDSYFEQHNQNVTINYLSANMPIILDYYIINGDNKNVVKIFTYNVNALKNKQYRLVVTINKKHNNTYNSFVLFNEQATEFEFEYNLAFKCFAAQLINNNSDPSDPDIIDELINIQLNQNANESAITNNVYCPDPQIDILAKPDEKYPFKISIKYQDPYNLPNHPSYSEGYSKSIRLKYNISNYGFIINENLKDITNVYNGNNIYTSTNYIIVDSSTLQNSTEYIINDTVLDSLQIDSSKPIYITAQLEYIYTEKTVYANDYSSIITKTIDINKLYKNEYFSITAKSSVQVSLNNNTKLSPELTYVSFDKYTWQKLTTITIPANATAYFKGYNVFSNSIDNYYNRLFNFSGANSSIIISGNILSLQHGDNFKDKDNSVILYNGFQNVVQLFSAKNLVLPSTVRVESYYQMFSGCTYLEYGPELPATILYAHCYYAMFGNCSNLKETPKLLAKNVAQSCYSEMFANCGTIKINSIYGNIYDVTPQNSNAGNMFNNTTGTLKLLPNYYRETSMTASNVTITNDQLLYENEYLTIENEFAGTIKLVIGENVNNSSIKNITYVAYSLDNGLSWNKIEIPNNNEQIVLETPYLKAGTKVLWKGIAQTYCAYDIENYFNTNGKNVSVLYNLITDDNSEFISGYNRKFVNGKIKAGTCAFIVGQSKISGNIMSLLYGDDFMYKYELTSSYTFAFLFCGNGFYNFLNTEDLCLPAINLSKGCYAYMFAKSRINSKTPILKINRLCSFSCTFMFFHTRSISDIQYFEINELEIYPQEAVCACSYMFSICNDYNYNNNSSLCVQNNSSTPILSTELPESYKIHFDNVHLKAEFLTSYCYNNMFSGNILGNIPSNFLPSTHLALSCYEDMFGSGNNTMFKHGDWVSFHDYHINTNLTSYDIQNLDINNVHESRFISVPDDLLPATILAPVCYSGMFSRTSIKTAPNLPSLETKPYCYSSMFAKCYYLKKAPVLNAKVLTNACYFSMFNCCHNLEYVEMNAEEISGGVGCYAEWLNWIGYFDNRERILVLKNSSLTRKINIYHNNDSTNGSKYEIFDIFYFPVTSNWYDPAALSESEIHEIINCQSKWKIHYSKYYNVPFTIKPTDTSNPATVTITKGGSININKINVSIHTIDATTSEWTWIGYSSFSTALSLPITAGKELSICADYYHAATSSVITNSYTNKANYSLYYTDYRHDIHITCTEEYEAYGNISSLLTSATNDDFINIRTATSPSKFIALFAQDDNFSNDELNNLTKADNLYLSLNTPTSMLLSTTTNFPTGILLGTSPVNLPIGIYCGMFNRTQIKRTPTMPAINIGSACYSHMYLKCKNLEVSESLPATTLYKRSYYAMFDDCESLKIAPELPANTLAEHSYTYMFSDCVSLTYMKILAGANQLNSTKSLGYIQNVGSNVTDGIYIYNENISEPNQSDESYGYPTSFIAYKNGQVPTPLKFEIIKDTILYNQTSEVKPAVSLYSNENTNFATATVIIKNTNSNTELYFASGTEALCGGNVYTLSRQTQPEINGINYIDTINPKIWYDRLEQSGANIFAVNKFTSTTLWNFPQIYDQWKTSATSITNATNLLKQQYISYNLNQPVVKSLSVGDIFIQYDQRYFTTKVYTFLQNVPQTLSFTIGTAITSSELRSISYSTDNGETWNTTYNDDTKTEPIVIDVSVYDEDEILWKGDGDRLGQNIYDPSSSDDDNFGCYFSSDANTTFDIYGNIESLRFGDDFIEMNNHSAIMEDGAYQYLFKDASVNNAENLILPWYVSENCYVGMFKNSSLLRGPELVSNDIEDSDACYAEMFMGCANLQVVPNMYFSNTSQYCCYRMFKGCTTIDQIYNSVLNPTVLAANCYREMFMNCTNLEQGNDLYNTSWMQNIATINDSSCKNMFFGCTKFEGDRRIYISDIGDWETLVIVGNSNTNVQGDAEHSFDGMFTNTKIKVISLPITNLTTNSYCYSHICSDCSSLERIIEIGATGLGDHCFYFSFLNCPNLSAIPVLPATELETYCYSYMFAGTYYNANNIITNQITTLPDDFLPATELANGCYEGMFRYCTNLETAPELPATELANNCYYYMFYGCTSLTTAPELPATTLYSQCYQSMFEECSSLEEAPELPAEYLSNRCYEHMFYNCSSLNYIKAMFTGAPSTSYTSSWVYGVSNTGTFVKNGYAPWNINNYRGINGVPTNWNVVEQYREDDYEKKYLTIIPTSSGTFNFTPFNNNSIYYSLDDGLTWNQETSNMTLNLNYGDKVLLKGNMVPQNSGGNNGIGNFSSTCYYEVQGNIMSLIFGDDFRQHNGLDHSNAFIEGAFRELFMDNTRLIDAGNLILDGSSIPEYCYAYMFFGCTSLTTAPKLPATTMAESCYCRMFGECTSLETAPELPATTMAENCYNGMFEGCTSLKTAPELPSTTLATDCYSYMFNGCTSLTKAPELSATTLADSCYAYMFYGCTSLTTAPELPATTLADHCYEYMFEDCTSLESAPDELPAIILLQFCYYHMFYDCISLTKAPKLPAFVLVYKCYYEMFRNCTSLNYVYASFVTEPGTNYTDSWLYNVSSTGTFIKNGAAEWSNDITPDYNAIPDGWSIGEKYNILFCDDFPGDVEDTNWLQNQVRAISGMVYGVGISNNDPRQYLSSIECDAYILNNTIEINNQVYYLWESMSLDNNYYVATETISNDLYRLSCQYDITNRNTPFITLDQDQDIYASIPLDILFGYINTSRVVRSGTS